MPTPSEARRRIWRNGFICGVACSALAIGLIMLIGYAIDGSVR